MHVESALDALGTIKIDKISEEIAELRAIATWARVKAGIDYEVGDRVVIVSHEPFGRASAERNRDGSHNGWYRYRESLAVGQTGIVQRVYFSEHRSEWVTVVGLDRAWSVDETRNWQDNTVTVERRWKGPVAELPAGYVLPSRWTVDRYPDGQMQVFYMDSHWVRKDVPGVADFVGCDR